MVEKKSSPWLECFHTAEDATATGEDIIITITITIVVWVSVLVYLPAQLWVWDIDHDGGATTVVRLSTCTTFSNSSICPSYLQDINSWLCNVHPTCSETSC